MWLVPTQASLSSGELTDHLDPGLTRGRNPTRHGAQRGALINFNDEGPSIFTERGTLIFNEGTLIFNDEGP